jgi:hypothetical protein
LAGEQLKVLNYTLGRRNASVDNHVVFLSGVPRSGTNMVMELLERSPEAKVFHERDPRAYKNFMLRDDETIKRLSKSLLPCVIFKALCEADRLSELTSYFPHASIIWVYRQYEAVNASNMVHWPGGKNGLDKLVVDRKAAGWRGKGMTEETWELIKKHYHPDLNVESAQALFWYYRNQLFFDQELDRDPRVLLLRYESIARDPATEFTRLANFLGVATPKNAPAHFLARSGGHKLKLSITPSIRTLCDGMLRRLDRIFAHQNSASFAGAGGCHQTSP